MKTNRDPEYRRWLAEYNRGDERRKKEKHEKDQEKDERMKQLEMKGRSEPDPVIADLMVQLYD